MKWQHEAGSDIIWELAINLYPSPRDSFREAISNALDEGSKRVEIHISLQEVIVEDWGEGIKDFDKFKKFGDYGKAKLGGEIIGEKGLGKLSLLRVGKNVEFRTNNGEYGMDIQMTPKATDNTMEIGAVSKFLPHQGTQIIIPNPDEVPPVDELADYLRDCFGLRIASGIEVILNGIKLEASAKIDPKEHFICRLKGGIEVTGNIKAEKKGKGSLIVHIKHVKVKSIIVDPTRQFAGWVNCNELTPTTARDNIVDNNIYRDLMDHLQEYVTKFPKIEEQLGRDEIQLGNEIAKLFEGYLKDMGLLPQGKLPFGRGNESALGRGRTKATHSERVEETEEEHEYIREHKSPKSDKPIKRSVRSKSGLTYVTQDAGNEKEPLFFIEPNILVCNRTNDIFKFALKKKQSLGYRWLRLLPYLARVAVTRKREYVKWTREQTNLEVDGACRYFLQEKGEL